MENKHYQIRLWLEEVFGDERVPQYEIDEYTLHTLSDLMRKSEMQDSLVSTMIQDIKLKTTEYSSEYRRIQAILRKMYLQPEKFTGEGEASLRTVCQSALALEVVHPSDACMLLAISKNTRRKLELQKQLRQEQVNFSQLLTNTKDALQRYNNLNRTLSNHEEQAQFQENDLQKKSKQATFLGSKAKEYKKQIHSLQLDLAHDKVEPSIHHGTLLQKAEDLSQLKEELKPLKSKLHSYRQLPPDLPLASVKVEEAKRELARLEDELSRHINMMVL